MRTTILSILLFAAAGSQLGATDCGNALRDPGFDLWCGDHLCAWKVERGGVLEVPTWNEGDPGVELVGTDAAIEQLSPVSSSDGACLEFDLIANIDETAEVDLNVDVFGDGSIEHTERIPTSHWKLLSYLLPIQGTYGGVRFELTKHGSGHAVLAQIAAKVVDGGCAGLPPIMPAPAPVGAACSVPAGCASGMCTGGACVGCVPGDASCTGGEVCGLGDPTSPVFAIPQECVPASARQLGENCLADSECASGICTAGACSTCRYGVACSNGEVCEPAWPAPPELATAPWHTPYECSPHTGLRTSGEPCASNDDCASGTCTGPARMQCDDGRRCATAADCPFGGPDTQNPLQNGPCNKVGVQGGTCQ